MVRIIKKRTYFFVGILLSGLASALGGYARMMYSKDASPLIPPAQADLAYWPADSGGSCGDGCGGCSGGDASGY